MSGRDELLIVIRQWLIGVRDWLMVIREWLIAIREWLTATRVQPLATGEQESMILPRPIHYKSVTGPISKSVFSNRPAVRAMI